MVIVLLFQEAATPAGRPLAPAVPAFAIPVAPVVVYVILDNAVLIQTVGVEEGDAAVLFGLTVNDEPLVAVPPLVVTLTVPVVPAPTTATITVAEVEVIEETGVPPIFTAVALVKLVPLIVIELPTQPLDGVKEVIVGVCPNEVFTKTNNKQTRVKLFTAE